MNGWVEPAGSGESDQGISDVSPGAVGKTHDLRELGKACAGVEPGLTPLLEEAAPLTWYAWKFRYPGAPEEPSETESREALTTARKVVAAILLALPEEVRA